MEPHHALTTVDYIAFGIIFGSALLALIRGFTRELFSLVAWIGAYIVASKFYTAALPLVHRYVHNDNMAHWGAIAAVFVAALIVLLIIGGIIAHFAVRGRTLTTIDRSLGFLFGMLRGTLVVSLIYLGVTMIMWPDIDWTPEQRQAYEAQQDAKNGGHYTIPAALMEAKTRPIAAYGASIVRKLIPADLLEKEKQNVTAGKEAAQKMIEQKQLDLLSTPAPVAPPAATP